MRDSDDETSSGKFLIAGLSFLRSLAGGRGNRGKLLAGVVLTLSLAGMSGCRLTEAGPTPTDEPTGGISKGISIGGVDLQGFCDDISFEAYGEAGTDVTCHSNINLLAACKSEYKAAVLFELKDPKNPKTGVCYGRNRDDLGGIKNMTGYCGKAYSAVDGTRVSRVRAELISLTWQCRMPVDLSAVCAGQHNDSTLKAGRVGDDWHCYLQQ